MSIAHASVALPAAERGSCEFLSRSERTTRCRQLAQRDYLVARVAPLAAASEPRLGKALVTGQLRRAIEGAVEISLALRGALPPSVSPAAGAAETAADQLLRVRRLGAHGLCLVLPQLRQLAREGVLDSDDSAALAVWRELCQSGPVTLLFDPGDRDLGMLAPQPLTEVFGAVLIDRDRALGSWADDERDADDEPHEHHDEDEEHEEHEEHEPAASLEAAELALEALEGAWNSDPGSVASHQRWHEADQDPETRRVMPRDPLAGLDDLDAGPRQGSLFERVRREPLGAPPPPLKPPLPREQVRALCSELTRQSGPKPVRAIEELFRSCYAPLLEALGRGLEDREADEAVASWRAAFEKSYGEGFTAMRVTGKRPTMVLDAPEVATRIARLNGARSVQLLLVDGMRYDLGQQVQHALRERMGEGAVCVEETLLWSALPTVTPVQLRLLAQGPRGLREQAPDTDREPPVQRGKSVTTLRRVRIGQRDLVKLDVVEARLREAGGGYDERLQGIAREVAQVVARFSESLSPRTLLFVFGDHGFTLPIDGPFASGPAGQGGTSPEEVLVGGFAWLIGDVH